METWLYSFVENILSADINLFNHVSFGYFAKKNIHFPINSIFFLNLIQCFEFMVEIFCRCGMISGIYFTSFNRGGAYLPLNCNDIEDKFVTKPSTVKYFPWIVGEQCILLVFFK